MSDAERIDEHLRAHNEAMKLNNILPAVKNLVREQTDKLIERMVLQLRSGSCTSDKAMAYVGGLSELYEMQEAIEQKLRQLKGYISTIN